MIRISLDIVPDGKQVLLRSDSFQHSSCTKQRAGFGAVLLRFGVRVRFRVRVRGWVGFSPIP